MDSVFLIISFISLIVVAIFTAITLVLSLKRDSRICCLGGGILLAFTSISIGLLGAGIFNGSVEPLLIVAAIVLFLIALFASLFTLWSTKQKMEFCCLAGGISLAGVALINGFILDFSLMEEDIGASIISAITLAIILIVAFLVILISLKNCKGLCCYGGTIALLGVVLGALGVALGSLIIFGAPFIILILLGILGVLFFKGNSDLDKK